MTEKELILDRYELLGTAGSGGFGTVSIAWDPRIQRKVAIKTIELTERDAYRASLPGAKAVAKDETQRNRRTMGRTRRAGDGRQALSPAEARTARLQAGREEYDFAFDFVPPLKSSEDFSVPAVEEQRQNQTEAWRGLTPWNEFLAQEDAKDGHTRLLQNLPSPENEGFDYEEDLAADSDERVTALAHLPGLDEARTAAKLSDPRIVTVYDFEVRERTAYLIMEYVEGITLTELLYHYDNFLTLDMVAQIFDAVSGALTVAHKAGVLHLDIKPDNIIINGEGLAKVTDFGLATLADASGAGTTGGGTIGYMPLEQMRREPLDARTDEWSLAAVAYEMLAGNNPFHASSLAEAETTILDAELILPSLCWNDLDDQIDDVIFYALDPDQDERYANVADFAEEMDKFLGDAEKGQGELALVVADALQKHGAEEENTAEGHESTVQKGGFLGWLPMAVASVKEEEGAPAKFGGRRDPLAPRDGATGLLNPTPRRRGHNTLVQPRGNAAPRRGLEARLSAYLEDYDRREAARELWVEEEPAYEEGEELPARMPFIHRFPEKFGAVAGRVFGACGAGFVGALALGNIPLVATLAGDSAPLVAFGAAVIVALLALFLLPVATLVSFCLLALAILWCGHPIVAAVLVVATGLWFYIVGRDDLANSNVVLLEPLAGSVGLGPVVPFAAGMALRPIQAGVSTALAVIIACVLGALGSSSLLGWDTQSYFNFMDADITRSFARIITRPLTWTMAAGWIMAAVGLALGSMRQSRWGLFLGLAIAVAAMLVGTLVFTAPTPMFFLALIVAVGAICLLYL